MRIWQSEGMWRAQVCGFVLEAPTAAELLRDLAEVIQ